jgi:D-glycero-D-manno-heptose 1,7-bisphosphate phosphatase
MTKLSKAIFLDRDGIINKERKDYVKSTNELEIFPYIKNIVKKFKDNGFLVVVITNQSAINRGLLSVEELNQIHSKIQSFLNSKNTKIDAFYHCPHRPDEYCKCRKPKPHLILQASSDLGIDLNQSWLIGDNDSDIQSATNAGCRSFKVNSYDSLNRAQNDILNHT